MIQRLIAAIGSVGAAFLASACCIGPSLAAVLGISGFGALLSLAVYRPYFLGLAWISLAYAYFLTYRKKARGERDRFLLWATTAVVVLLSAFPYFS